MSDTLPLYLYSNEDTERLSFEGILNSGMVKMGIIGYCYNKRTGYDCDELVEITDGAQFNYILNGEGYYNDGWKENGIRIYTKQINKI